MIVVPMRLVVAGETFLDGPDLAPTAFYRKLRDTSEAPTTSAPAPGGFLDAFRTAAREASTVLCLTVSPKFSSTYDSAREAVREAKQALPNVGIALLDTESAAGGEGLVAMAAWRAAQGGASLEDVLAVAEAVVRRVALLAFPDTLYYVWKSGRVPRIAYAGTSLLQIKPILELRRGEIRTPARPRTRPRAVQQMLELMRAAAGPGPLHAAVMHADVPEEAESLKRRVESEFACAELFVSEFSPVMGAHTGPGLLGVAFWTEGDQPMC